MFSFASYANSITCLQLKHRRSGGAQIASSQTKIGDRPLRANPHASIRLINTASFLLRVVEHRNVVAIICVLLYSLGHEQLAIDASYNEYSQMHAVTLGCSRV